MSSEANEIADIIRRFQRDWTVSTEPVFWGYPQLLREVPYTFTDFDFDNDLLRIRCTENASVLSVWSPRGVVINESGLRIADAQHVRWEWQVQGAPKTPPMLYFKEFWRTEQDVSGKSNSHWTPREVERRIDKAKAAVLWPACLRVRPKEQQSAAQVPIPETREADVKPEVAPVQPKASFQESAQDGHAEAAGVRGVPDPFGGTARAFCAWRARASWWLSLLAFGSLPLLWVYIFNSDIAQTGPMGYLFAFEVNTLGFADTALNMVLGLLAALVPCGLVEMAAHKLAQNAQEPSASPLTHATRRLRILPAFLTLLVLGLTALFIHDRNLKLYAIDLSAAVSSAPHDAGFIELKAILARSLASGYYSDNGKSTYVHTYQPLVSPGWTPHDPIRYFLFSRSRPTGFAHFWKGRSLSMEVHSVSSKELQALAGQFDQSSLKEFHGKVTGALPVIVRQDYEAKGFTVARDYIVIEHAYISGHKVSIWNRYDNLLMIGLIAGVLPLCVLMALIFSGVSKAWSLVGRMCKRIFGAATPTT